jgi:hypothetical protein
MRERGASRTAALLLSVSAAAVIGGSVFSQGPPALTLQNTGIRIEYPRGRGLAGLGGAAGFALAAVAVSRRWLRLALASAAVLASAVAADRLLYRLEAGPRALVARGALGDTTLAWSDVSRVEAGPEILVVWGRGDAQIRVATSDFGPELRATLERTIARRVAENAPQPR